MTDTSFSLRNVAWLIHFKHCIASSDAARALRQRHGSFPSWRVRRGYIDVSPMSHALERLATPAKCAASSGWRGVAGARMGGGNIASTRIDWHMRWTHDMQHMRLRRTQPSRKFVKFVYKVVGRIFHVCQIRILAKRRHTFVQLFVIAAGSHAPRVTCACLAWSGRSRRPGRAAHREEAQRPQGADLRRDLRQPHGAGPGAAGEGLRALHLRPARRSGPGTWPHPCVPRGSPICDTVRASGECQWRIGSRLQQVSGSQKNCANIKRTLRRQLRGLSSARTPLDQPMHSEHGKGRTDVRLLLQSYVRVCTHSGTPPMSVSSRLILLPALAMLCSPKSWSPSQAIIATHVALSQGRQCASNTVARLAWLVVHTASTSISVACMQHYVNQNSSTLAYIFLIYGAHLSQCFMGKAFFMKECRA